MQSTFSSRRGALKVLGALALSGVASQLLLSTRAVAALAQAEQPGQGLHDFIAVSKTLTGKAEINPTLALALYQAFLKTSSGGDFDGTVAGLKATLLGADVLAQEDKTTFTEAQKADQALSQAILQAWYLGVVGKAKKSVCVAYVDTLSNQAVADVLVPPSYSYGPCGTWSAKP